jgi:hypothetical protein
MVRTKNETPPSPCATVPLNLVHSGRPNCFRRPAKVSATITAGVPDRTILVQGPNCQSRTGQGKSDFPTGQRTAGHEPRFVPSRRSQNPILEFGK